MTHLPPALFRPAVSRFGTLCALLALALGAAALAGCGGGEPFEIVPVSGKVAYDDDSLIPAPRIVVVFVPQVKAADARTYPRQGQAEVNVADGTFSYATTRQPGDGVTAGRAKVLVMSYDARENLTGHVPAVYHAPETTPLEVDVGKDSREFPFKIKRP